MKILANTDELVKKLEMATGPSRELDCSIALAFGGFHLMHETGSGDLYCRGDERPGQAGDMLVPHYTGSMDAAIKLIPAWSWRVGNLPSGRAFADLGTQRSLQCVEGATPAIAICIAVGKAHLQREGIEKARK